MKMEQADCSETSAYKIQPLGNYPEETTQQFKSTLKNYLYVHSFHSTDVNKNDKIS
jgi:hypothetical protein